MGYLKLMDNIMINGIPTETRNGLVKSTFGYDLVFNLENFPLLTTKKNGLQNNFKTTPFGLLMVQLIIVY